MSKKRFYKDKSVKISNEHKKVVAKMSVKKRMTEKAWLELAIENEEKNTE
jgi:hypothetical protein